MTATLKRRRATVSYKEPSSDDELSDSYDSDHTPKKRRTAPQRRSTRHQDSQPEQATTDVEQKSSTVTGSPLRKRKAQPRLRRNRKVSYRETSSDEDSEADFEPEEEIVPSTSKGPSPGGRPSASVKASKRPKGRPRRTTYALGAPKKAHKVERVKAPPSTIVSDGKIPPWDTLPYHVLLQIFVYASHPLHDDNFNASPSIAWLARTARICRAFTKPALTALYRNPPVFAIGQSRKSLVRHLISPPAGAQHDYPVMVKRLELDGCRMSKLTDAQNSQDDLKSLLLSLKTLKEIDILDPFDKPPYRARSRRIRRWYYPDDLLTSLGNSEVRLQSWRWNSAFCGNGMLRLKEVHESNAFQNLREVMLMKFNPTETRKGDETNNEPTAEETLASALAVLPKLRSLTFESCGVVNKRLLPLLPANLVSLNITNCRELISDTLQAFLVSSGQRLEELVLNHNQSLDLSFLIDLKQTCPRLEILRIDMHYYNTLSTASDNEPLYDELLPEAHLPSWPSSLRVIDLEFLRIQSEDAAVAFFTSLIDAAENLPWLRVVILSAIVDIEWRQRAAFRQKWTARFAQVFAMRSPAPSPHLVSLRAFREWPQSTQHGEASTTNTSALDACATHVQPPTVDNDSDEDNSDNVRRPQRDTEDSENWGKKRLRLRVKSAARYEETSDSEAGSENGSGSEEESVNFIQGRCHTVEVRIDNSRPQEQIYEEADFLDEEVSGDEDWNGEDPEPNETSVALW